MLPLAAPILARLRGYRPIEAAASQTVELAPADRAETSEAIALPGEFERATGAMETTNMAEQRRLIGAGMLDHGATIGRLVENVTIVGAGLYASRAYSTFGPRPGMRVSSPCAHFDEAQFCGGQGGEFYFGHWLCDNLATEPLAAMRGLSAVTLRPRWMHEAGYRALFQLRATEVAHARFDRLWVIDDRGYNEARVARFRAMRTTLRAAVGDPRPNTRLYIARGTTGAKRALTNEPALIETLVARGFAVIEPEHMTPPAIATALAAAELVISIEGSALCHALMALPAGARMLTIQPPTRFNIFNKIIGDFAGLRTGYVVADPDGDGFRLDPDRLFRTIDLLDRAAA
ncbi:glycosyltransferase 61 family protein [Sphingomonas natans]|nr:glycosyltransferase family 61 protein [Sphingomonas sp. BIUV-7]